METLGSAGKIYIAFLFIFLIAGLGVFSLGLARKVWDRTEEFVEKKGGGKVNQWLKLAIVSFAGVLIASFALGLVSSNASGAHGATAGAHGTQPVANVNSNGYGYGNGYNNGYANGANMMGTGTGAAYNGNNSIQQQIYGLQMAIMQMQQMMQQMMQSQAGMNMNGGAMNNMNNPGTMNNMSNMSNMSNTSNTGSMSGSGGGMSMM